MQPKPATPQRKCVACHRPLNDDANVCPNCGHDYRPAMSGHGWGSEGTPLPAIGGAMIAYAGFAQTVAGLMWVFEDEFDLASSLEDVLLTAVIGFVAITIGAIAIAGGAYAITRRRLALALIGGAASVAGSGVLSVYSIGVIAVTTVGLIGILLVGISRNEFID